MFMRFLLLYPNLSVETFENMYKHYKPVLILCSLKIEQKCRTIEQLYMIV